MVDEIKKSELARQERARQQATEKYKPKPKESEFDKLVKKGQMSQAGQAAKVTSKPVTEQAIHEAARAREREQEMRRKDKEERKEKKEGRETGEKADAKVAEQKVVGKGSRGKGGQGQGGSSGKGGYGGQMAKRGLAKKLSKAGVRTLPMDLQKKFAAKMAKAAQDLSRPDAARLSQQVLNKIIQHVRIGINRKGEREIQIDLHERIFRGLKLRVTEKGGKVNVHFQMVDKKGRALFEKNADAIRDALTSKGIDVEEITVA
jgi:hypothetical protein